MSVIAQLGDRFAGRPDDVCGGEHHNGHGSDSPRDNKGPLPAIVR
jgi:hypothetical protein